MNQSLAELYMSRKLTLGDAVARSSNPQELNEMIQRGQVLAGAREHATVGG
jgi:hypothetical protein